MTLPIWFAETTLLASVLAGAAWLGSRSRRLSPSARHVLWLAVLLRLVIPPVVHWPWAKVWEFRLPALSVAMFGRTEPSIQQGGSVVPVKQSSLALEPLRSSPVAREPSAESLLATKPKTIVEPWFKDAAVALIFEPSEIFAPIKDEPVIAAAAPPLIAEPLANEAEACEETETVTASTLGTIFETGSRILKSSLVWGWLIGSLVIAGIQGSRILAFRRRLRPDQTGDAPEWLVKETRLVGDLLGVRPPLIRTLSGISSPMLWCLGKPVLLIPRHLLESLDVSRWRGILAHEMAHLRRGDPWVSRLELIAGLVWWWNPLYWMTRRQLDTEAELACDAWVVSLLPDDRLTYAESLVRVCSGSPPVPSARVDVPVLGVAGAGQFFERRLTMILRDSVTCRASAWNALVAALLLLVSAPAWTLATPPAAVDSINDELPSPFALEDDDKNDAEEAEAAEAAEDKEKKEDKNKDEKAAIKEKARVIKEKLKQAKAEQEKLVKEKAKIAKEQRVKEKAINLKNKVNVTKPIVVEVPVVAPVATVAPVAPVPPVPPVPPVAAQGHGVKTLKGPGGATISAKVQPRGRLFVAKTAQSKEKGRSDEAEIAEAKAEAHEKKLEAAEAAFEAKMDAFEQKMEAFAEGMVEKALGEDFEKRMEAFGKDMEKMFGPGSEFAKSVESLGKDMEKKLGPGSEFEKSVKEMGKRMEKQFGPGSEFEKTIRKNVEEAKAQAEEAKREAKEKAKNEIDKQKAEGTKRQAEKEKARNDIEKRKAEVAKRQAEKEKAKSDNDRQKAEIDKRQADKEKARTDSEKQNAELSEQKVKQDKLHAAEAQRAQAREAREKANSDRKLAQEARAKEARAQGKVRDRERRIKLLEEQLGKLMGELKQLENEGQASEE